MFSEARASDHVYRELLLWKIPRKNPHFHGDDEQIDEEGERLAVQLMLNGGRVSGQVVERELHRQSFDGRLNGL